jgi:hypothetical protein
MKIIEGIANVYKESNGEHMFDYSVFVYPNDMIARAQLEKQGPKEKMMMVGGRPVKIKIEIAELEWEVKSYANGSAIAEG